MQVVWLLVLGLKAFGVQASGEADGSDVQSLVGLDGSSTPILSAIQLAPIRPLAESYLELESSAPVATVGGAARGVAFAGKVAQMDLSKELTPEMFKEMPPCSFYKEHPGTCYPDAAYSPCRFCKTQRTFKHAGTPECDLDFNAFPAELQFNYEFRIKPYVNSKNVGRQYVCVVEALSAAEAAAKKQQAFARAGGGAQQLCIGLVLLTWLCL